ncbi:putative ribosomal protein S12e [Helianthus annuus]|nr:putative ribosomal protein S12e [Helianthus annuus]KAJ0619184.1 putative ribosomal protein S12e [Helianthus annuus]KAJ0777635.1 putative ribosomal protein S12e [Helianthus annuus]KAJ0786661.1 putative ribosomal protein S12e [Helianthus annuus]KAJ0805806.1 putative ribosomal protein S12e [Helianthus annuus]
MAAGEDGVVPVEAAAPAPALGEPMDTMTTLQLVLRKSLAHGGLVRGLHEAAKVIEKHGALLCVLAEDDPWRVGWYLEGKARKVVGCSCLVVKVFLNEKFVKTMV